MIIEVVGIVHRVLEKIKPIVQQFALQEFLLLHAVNDDLRKIKQTLQSINTVLVDAQQQQATSANTRDWLERIQFVASDIEDVLDLISTQELETKVNGTNMLEFIKKIAFDYGVARKLKGIRESLDEIQRDKSEFNFQVQSIAPFPIQRPSCLLAPASTVFGRQKDIEAIISRLVGDDANGLSVIPIFGISGMGKTTLALQIFNDPLIKEAFDLRLWGSASKNFDISSLIMDLLTSAFHRDFSHLSDIQLQNKLVEEMCGQTCLLMIDDVWILDSADWKDFMNILKVGASTVRIIVTTREQCVSSLTRTTSQEEYCLKGLSDDECWCIFAQYAFQTGEEKAYSSLVKIGKSIVQKCHGIPLVAKTLGAFLNDHKTDDVWKRVESDFSQIAQKHDRILSALTLSYDRIPYSLRPCFAQCVVYGKGQPLFRTDVINMWMALGLLDSKEANEDLEVIGARYFNELLSRSFFQSPGYEVSKKVIIEYGKIFDGSILWADIAEMFESDWRNNLHLVLNTFFQPVQELFFLEMHDLLHQLATHVSGNEIAFVTADTHDVPERAMHILCNQEDLSSAAWRLSADKKARSFAFVHPVSCVSKTFLKGLISCLEYLRILDLSFSEFEKLPDSVGDLKHLRCLKLGWNSKLVGLPDSVCKLVNLQTLELFRCTAFEKLPKDIQKLVSLRFLSLSSKLVSLPLGLFGLTSLRVLRLAFCENLCSLSQEIGNLKNLLHLEIICCARLDRLPAEMRELMRLQQLSIFCCARLDLGGWEGLYGLEGLKYLDLNELPQLKVFPRGLIRATSLQHLRIQKCEHLSDLGEGLNKCTSLSKLTLSGCPMLTHIPRSIRNLKCLRQVNIDECPEIAKSCVKGGSDWDRISHVPEIIIDRQHVQK